MHAEAQLSVAQQFRIARAQSRRLLARAFDESKHPRDEDGKWTSGGGGGGDSEAVAFEAPPAPNAPMSEQEIHKAIVAVSKDLNYDPATIFIDNGEPKLFEVNGRQYKTAGLAHISDIGKFNQLITIFSRTVQPFSIDGLIAHEIQHIKYETALNRYLAEERKMMEEPRGETGSRDPVMRADGTLKPPYDEKYPAYTAMYPVLFSASFKDYAAADGVSEYSYDWWKDWKAKGGLNSFIHGKSAVHETLAEMARIKYQSGRFPEHMGEHILSWRGEDTPKPSKATMEKNAKLWRDLYRAVDKVWNTP